MKPLTEADLAWLENRLGKKRWTVEDCGRILADLRAVQAVALFWTNLHSPAEKEFDDGR